VIRNKYGKEIYLIERFVTGVMEGKYLMWVHAGASLYVGEKSNIFRSITFQNVVQNSCNTGLVMHLQVDLP
jgi:hypothetical protein